MKPTIDKSGRFRSKAAELLTPTAPSSVKAFLDWSLSSPEADSKTHIAADPQHHNTPNKGSNDPVKQGRLHIEIRQDLVQQLMQCVFQRKCDPGFKGRATQRAVIEEALEDYFRRHSL